MQGIVPACQLWPTSSRLGVKVMGIRILTVDDDKTIRLLLRRLLETHSAWEVCGEACDGREAIQQAEHLKPDLIIMDLAMPGMNGLQAAERLSQVCPEVPL